MCIDCKHFKQYDRITLNNPSNYSCDKIGYFSNIPESYLGCQFYQMKDKQMAYSLKQYIHILQMSVAVIDKYDMNEFSDSGHALYDKIGFMVDDCVFFFYEISRVEDYWIIFVKEKDDNHQMIGNGIRFFVFDDKIECDTGFGGQSSRFLIDLPRYNDLFLEEVSL